ncbi:hypothetical protein NCLIV_004600 [Neospora caninum Liverpool]|uniref:Ubiquitin-like protein ATG12 n=1 Tax=Neospora caninum (strain Liverpool) TaxID=572307 RepID=F0V8E2_NEOCL|nr:hypothetical protein NCLIV_004600 [Neospora caninum Liverpool]CBZ49983.1 hypothetical protein NCLIV_004600 [Neospora caninum Liverpool]CEL64571.1 TPA: Ubiquitin-like protein ATG12B [Neospora caninum Liverpool]|eukprot:XP_003880018.1 hypothetical protein NCLIV_004600 [Neospora caninum Liverpool]
MSPAAPPPTHSSCATQPVSAVTSVPAETSGFPHPRAGGGSQQETCRARRLLRASPRPLNQSPGHFGSETPRGSLDELEAIHSTSSSGDGSSLLDSSRRSSSLVDSRDSDLGDDGFFKLGEDLGREPGSGSFDTASRDALTTPRTASQLRPLGVASPQPSLPIDGCRDGDGETEPRRVREERRSGRDSVGVLEVRRDSGRQETSRDQEAGDDGHARNEECRRPGADAGGGRSDAEGTRGVGSPAGDSQKRRETGLRGVHPAVPARPPPSVESAGEDLNPREANSATSRPFQSAVATARQSQICASRSRDAGAWSAERLGSEDSARAGPRPGEEDAERTDGEGRRQTPVREASRLAWAEGDYVEDEAFESPQEDLESGSRGGRAEGTPEASSSRDSRQSSDMETPMGFPAARIRGDSENSKAGLASSLLSSKARLGSPTGREVAGTSTATRETGKAPGFAPQTAGGSEEPASPQIPDAHSVPPPAEASFAPEAAATHWRRARGRDAASVQGVDTPQHGRFRGSSLGGERAAAPGGDYPLRTESQRGWRQGRHPTGNGETEPCVSDAETASVSDRSVRDGDEEGELEWIPPVDPSWSVENHLFQLRDFKVHISLANVGGAARLRVSRFKVDGYQRFDTVISFLKKALKRDHLFVYINNFVQPQPDEFVADLFKAFGVGGNLLVSYCYTPAY